MNIRAETPADYDSIAKLLVAAFDTNEELRLVDAIRASEAISLS
jgi:predicted N-acetyltransferase YhbS